MLVVHPRHAGDPRHAGGTLVMLVTLIMLVVHLGSSIPTNTFSYTAEPTTDYKFLKELVPSENVPLSYASDTCKTVGLVFSFFGHACVVS